MAITRPPAPTRFAQHLRPAARAPRPGPPRPCPALQELVALVDLGELVGRAASGSPPSSRAARRGRSRGGAATACCEWDFFMPAYTAAMNRSPRRSAASCAPKRTSSRPVVIIGDKGLTDEVLAEIDRSLKAHELIKVRAATDDRDARDVWMRDDLREAGAAAGAADRQDARGLPREPGRRPNAKPRRGKPSPSAPAGALARREARRASRRRQTYFTSTISNSFTPPGVRTSATSPEDFPMSALAIGRRVGNLPELDVGLVLADDLVGHRLAGARCPAAPRWSRTPRGRRRPAASGSMICALASLASSSMMRPSMKPWRSRAASYSAFSVMSPCARASAIAVITAGRSTVFSLCSSARSSSAPLSGDRDLAHGAGSRGATGCRRRASPRGGCMPRQAARAPEIVV